MSPKVCFLFLFLFVFFVVVIVFFNQVWVCVSSQQLCVCGFRRHFRNMLPIQYLNFCVYIQYVNIREFDFGYSDDNEVR